jgi:hypothetical protein
MKTIKDTSETLRYAFAVSILKPVWLFKKPKPGCSYLRTENAEDFTRVN